MIIEGLFRMFHSRGRLMGYELIYTYIYVGILYII